MKRTLASILVLCLALPIFGSDKSAAATGGCRALVHLGDSLSLNTEAKIKSLYHYMGFTTVEVHAVNGGSIWYPSGRSGLEMARYYRKKYGTNICWVIALGTNDSASSNSKQWTQRIDSIMSVIGKDPVMWVNVWFWSKTRPNYNLFVATAWNSLLFQYQKKYANIRIFDWATIAKSNPGWFIYDGLHYNSTGMSRRALWISSAAGIMFPYTPR